MDSKVGLIIQLNGIVLITVLSLCLRRSLKLTSLRYWTHAWLALSFSLVCLRLGFGYHEFSSFLFTYYFLGQYIFGFMLVAGCRSLNTDYELRQRSEWLMVPFVIASIVLPQLRADLNDVLWIHAIVMSGFYAVSFFHLRRNSQPNFGWYVMRVSLLLLTADLLMYAAAFTARSLGGPIAGFLSFNSVVDLVLQTALGFGMVIVLLEKVLRDAEDTNEKLRSTQKELELLVHTDPLTAAFNRHAFYGFVRRQGEAATAVSGCVGFFDVDDLKAINDCFGHTAGDVVIRTVVRTIREIIRAEDLIYRWGGDEFFVIMVSMESDMAENRMTRLDAMLRQVYIENIPDPINLGVSWGFTNFADINELEEAIKKADGIMYRRKELRKQRNTASVEFINSLPGGPSRIPVES